LTGISSAQGYSHNYESYAARITLLTSNDEGFYEASIYLCNTELKKRAVNVVDIRMNQSVLSSGKAKPFLKNWRHNNPITNPIKAPLRSVRSLDRILFF